MPNYNHNMSESQHEKNEIERHLEYHLEITRTASEHCPTATPTEDIYQYYVDHCEAQNILPMTFGGWIHLDY